jgi:transposase
MQRESKPRTKNDIVVGVDVSKASIDICLLPERKFLQLANDEKGHKALIEELSNRTVACVVMEATGPYHVKLHQALDHADLLVSVVNPYRSRKFADVCGRLAKTDRIDAEMLAHFAVRIEPPLTPSPTDMMIEIRSLVHARESLTTDRAALKNRLEGTSLPRLRALFEKRITDLVADIEALEADIIALIKSDADLDRRLQILLSMPGVGAITAMTLIATMPELGSATAKEIAALTGVAPMNWDSGFMRGKRSIRGGRHAVRKALYMPALSVATRGQTSFSKTYRTLINNGKPFKVAITAIMRKLIVMANMLVHKNVMWDPDLA